MLSGSWGRGPEPESAGGDGGGGGGAATTSKPDVVGVDDGARSPPASTNPNPQCCCCCRRMISSSSRMDSAIPSAAGCDGWCRNGAAAAAAMGSLDVATAIAVRSGLSCEVGESVGDGDVSPL